MYTIYCDMDGVIADFDQGYLELTGQKASFDTDPKEFWKPLEEAGAAFWANLPWMPDGPQLWRYIKRYKPNILSAPSQDPASRVGKEAWCKMHINNQYRKLLLYPRNQKQTFAEPGRVLIDDMKQTINEWNAKGGIGIHHTSASNTIAQLKKLGL